MQRNYAYYFGQHWKMLMEYILDNLTKNRPSAFYRIRRLACGSASMLAGPLLLSR